MPPTRKQYGKKPRKQRTIPLLEQLPAGPTQPTKGNPAALKDVDTNKLVAKLYPVNPSKRNEACEILKSPKKILVAEKPSRRSARNTQATRAATRNANAPLQTLQPDIVIEDYIVLQGSISQLEPQSFISEEHIPRRTTEKVGRSSNTNQESNTEPFPCSDDTEAKPAKASRPVSKSKSKSVKAVPETKNKHKVESEPPETTITTPSELSWSDICPPTSTITKIAEASFAEVYRVRNPLGTSIIKVIRLSSPLKPQTKAQIKSELVDEEPHGHSSTSSELLISQWLAGIPGFVVYKEQFLVKGQGTPDLRATHQAFHKKLKRRDPDRLQFYPSPSRYLAETKFLVVELGDAGTALEDFEIAHLDMVWDIFFLLAIALARAEELAGFEHRDLHEGNICVRRVRDPMSEAERAVKNPGTKLGFSGLDITVLDYGLSRADDPNVPVPDDVATEEEAGLQQRHQQVETDPFPSGESKTPPPSSSLDSTVAFSDLENDLSLFTSTHAAQCAVYRRMRSHLLEQTRSHLPPSHPSYKTPYPISDVTGEPLDWAVYAPYTNVLWLAYIYRFLVTAAGKCLAGGQGKKSLREFKKETAEMWRHLDPDAPGEVDSFACAGDIVMFAVDMGWVEPAQLIGGVGGDGDHSLMVIAPVAPVERQEEKQTKVELDSEQAITRGMGKLALETIPKEDEGPQEEEEKVEEVMDMKNGSFPPPEGSSRRGRRKHT